MEDKLQILTPGQLYALSCNLQLNKDIRNRALEALKAMNMTPEEQLLLVQSHQQATALLIRKPSGPSYLLFVIDTFIAPALILAAGLQVVLTIWVCIFTYLSANAGKKTRKVLITYLCAAFVLWSIAVFLFFKFY